MAKDLAYFTILAVLVLPLNLGTGLTFGMAAVAIGRYPSLRRYSPQRRWRFVSGDLRFGVSQIVVGMALGIANYRMGWWCFGIAALAYGVSLLAGNRMWERPSSVPQPLTG